MLATRRFDACVLALVLLVGGCFGGEQNSSAADWPMWGGTPLRNNAPVAANVPGSWDVGARPRIRREDGKYEKNPNYPDARGPFVPAESKNIKWAVRLGSLTYGNPSVAGGKVFIGTNNHGGYIKRFPKTVDLGVLLCFEEESGRFLWQYSSPKLPTGRVHDWPDQGMPSTPLVDGDRLWAVTNRCEVICLDTEGFHDHENDGPFRTEEVERIDEADVIWKFDMMSELGVSPHNMSNCSMCAANGRLFVCTSNGVDEGHIRIPAPEAPAFMAMNRETGEVLWTDNSPGTNVLHGQWASPSYAVLGGRPQVIFAGGDGWLYSFDPAGDGRGGSRLLWKFDCNPKTSVWVLGGRGTRNNIIGFPAIYNDLVYVAVGQDPEHGEGVGHLWCIDPTRRTDGSDVSPEFVVDDGDRPVPPRRIDAMIQWQDLFRGRTKVWEGIDGGIISDELRAEFAKAGVTLPDSCVVSIEEARRRWIVTATADGVGALYRISARSYHDLGEPKHVFNVERSRNEFLVANPNSAAVWHYHASDLDGNGKIDWEEEMHRSISTPVIKDDILYIADFSGGFHCLDARTGKPYWTYDLFAQCWGSALIADDKVFIADEDGDVAVFRHAADPEIVRKSGEPLEEFNMHEAVYSTPIIANDVLYLATKLMLYAIAPGPDQVDGAKRGPP